MLVVYKKLSTAETQEPASQTALEGGGISETAFLSRGFYSQTGTELFMLSELKVTPARLGKAGRVIAESFHFTCFM